MSCKSQSLCAVWKGCVLPLYSGGPNGIGRRVGAYKSGRE